MARDMKKSRASSSRSGGGGSLVTGLVVGLLGGVAVAVGVALFLNRSDSPFTKTNNTPPDAIGSAPQPTNKQPEVLHPGGSGSSAPALPEATKPASTPEAASGAERFDFYKVLPELNKDDGKQAATEAKPVVPTKKPEFSPPAKVEAPKGAYLQVGAFQNEQEADNLKAKLALVGVEATILSSNSADKGLWHRVRIGPFTNLADLDKARAQLKGSGIDSTVVKGN
ncbi:SPOR domain-containing protein [Jeongeupia wiesaeckerbachi]|uniref:SPOR domain-containing protein n=1 Tax=Jeongeupia wiesaeckerbachi TaxID=3051218 RepID=UPI003D8057A2